MDTKGGSQGVLCNKGSNTFLHKLSGSLQTHLTSHQCSKFTLRIVVAGKCVCVCVGGGGGGGGGGGIQIW